MILFDIGIDLNLVECVDITCELRENENFQTENDACYVVEVITVNKGDTLNFILKERKLTDITAILFVPPGQKQSNITFIPTEIFEIFPQLRKLELKANIQKLNKEDFLRANHLEHLTVNNDLEILTERVFLFAQNLTSLILSKNRIAQIEDYAFLGLNQLEQLGLGKNHLTSLKRHTFAGLTKLNFLNLRDNSIESIDDGAFDLPSLTELTLSKNNIKRLSDQIFDGAPLLRNINIDNNELEQIGTSLYRLQNALRIVLYQNKITDLNLREFAKLPELTALWLRDSGFKFDNESVETYQPTQSKLTYLDISSNNLSNNENLKKLVLFTHLKTLALDGNQFTEINFGDRSIKQQFPELETIHLSQNKWNCRWLEKTLEELKRDHIRPVSSECHD